MRAVYAVAVLLCSFGLAVAQSSMPEPAPSGSHSLSPSSVSFGNVGVDQVSEQSLTIRNTGTALLTGNAVLASATQAAAPGSTVLPAFDIAQFAGLFALNPGGTRTLSLSFKPNQAGGFQDNLVITSSDPLNPQVSVPVTGQGGP